jgi:hypothetical protein
VHSACFSRDSQNARNARDTTTIVHDPSSSSSSSTYQAHGDWPNDLFCSLVVTTTSYDCVSLFCLLGCCARSPLSRRRAGSPASASHSTCGGPSSSIIATTDNQQSTIDDQQSTTEAVCRLGYKFVATTKINYLLI